MQLKLESFDSKGELRTMKAKKAMTTLRVSSRLEVIVLSVFVSLLSL